MSGPAADAASTAAGASTASGDGCIRVRVHPALCEGWGNCHRFAPDVYPLDVNGHIDVHLVEVPDDLAPWAVLGADACPEHAITIIRGSSSHRSGRDHD
jgi:ferredoxin